MITVKYIESFSYNYDDDDDGDDEIQNENGKQVTKISETYREMLYMSLNFKALHNCFKRIQNVTCHKIIKGGLHY